MHQIQIQDLLSEFENLILIENSVKSIMSHDAKKPAFCLCENKDADQLFFLNPHFQISSI